MTFSGVGGRTSGELVDGKGWRKKIELRLGRDLVRQRQRLSMVHS